MFKVALVVPFFRKINQRVSYMEYLGFSSIASYLRQNNIHVDIIDAYLQDLNIDDVVRKLSNDKYDLIGFTLMSSEFFYNAEMILKKLMDKKRLNSKVLVGGYYATFSSEKILKETKYIDIVVIGEGEKTILDIIINSIIYKKDLKNVKGIHYIENNEIIKTEHRTIMTSKELTELPMMARDTAAIVLKNKRKLQMLSSRGCYGNCSFCGVNKYTSMLSGPKWRYREAKNVVDEMEMLINKYNVQKIIFLDEEFIGTGSLGKNRARKIGELLLERNLKIKFLIYSRSNNVDLQTLKILKKAGLESVFLGLEFGVQRLLDFYNKRITVEDNIKALDLLKQLEIKIKPGYIMFEPTMSLQELKGNFSFYYKYLAFRPNNLLSKLGLYKNTPAYCKIREITNVNEIEVLSEDYGDCVEYNFLDDKVNHVYNILKYSLSKVDNFKDRRTNIGLLSSSLDRAVIIEREFEKELFQSVIGLVDKLESINNLNENIIENIKNEFVKNLIYINNKI